MRGIISTCPGLNVWFKSNIKTLWWNVSAVNYTYAAVNRCLYLNESSEDLQEHWIAEHSTLLALLGQMNCLSCIMGASFLTCGVDVTYLPFTSPGIYIRKFYFLFRKTGKVGWTKLSSFETTAVNFSSPFAKWDEQSFQVLKQHQWTFHLHVFVFQSIIMNVQSSRYRFRE